MAQKGVNTRLFLNRSFSLTGKSAAMEIERVERILEIIYPDNIPRGQYKKAIELLAEIGLMITSQPDVPPTGANPIPASSGSERDAGNPRRGRKRKKEILVVDAGQKEYQGSLTEDQVCIGEKMRQEGATYKEIAHKVGCSASIAYKRFSCIQVNGKEQHATTNVHTGTIKRACLKCDKLFISTGRNNRICQSCQKVNNRNGEAKGTDA